MFPEFRPATVSNGRVWYELSKQTPNAQLAMLGLFCIAIAEFEGFYKAGSLAQRNNNPGNLRPVGASEGFRTFSDVLQGWEALKDQVIRNIDRGLTLRQFFLGKEGVYPGYAPLGDNPANVMENYIDHVAKRLSIPENLDLRNYFPSLVDVEATMIPVQGILWGYKPFEDFYHA